MVSKLLAYFCLTISLFVASFSYLFFEYETTYDNFRTDYSQIYRVELDQNFANNFDESNSDIAIQRSAAPITDPRLADIIKDKYTDDQVTVVRVADQETITIQNNSAKNIVGFSFKAFHVDENIFDFLDIKIIDGDKRAPLTTPSSIALSQSSYETITEIIPLKIGSYIEVGGGRKLKLTAIFEDIPRNSNFGFEALMKFDGRNRQKTFILNNKNSITRNSKRTETTITTNTFVKLKTTSQTDMEAFLEVLPDRYAYLSGESFVLTPLRKLHTHAVSVMNRPNGNITIINALAILSLSIFIISIFNHKLYLIVKMEWELKKISLIKIFGISSSQLMLKILKSISAKTLILLPICIACIVFTLEIIRSKTGNPPFEIHNYTALAITLLIVIFFVQFLSTPLRLYRVYIALPKLILSASQKGMHVGRITIQSVLSLQFFASVFLTCILTLSLIQINQVLKIDRNFNQQDLQTIFVSTSSLEDDSDWVSLMEINEYLDDFEEFKNSAMSDISIPGFLPSPTKISTLTAQKDSIDLYIPMVSVSLNFFDFLEIGTVTGQTFSVKRMSDNFNSDIEDLPIINIVVTKRFVELLGFRNIEDVVNSRITLQNGQVGIIIGVVEDTVFGTYTKKPKPIIYYSDVAVYKTLTLRSTNQSDIITTLQNYKNISDSKNYFTVIAYETLLETLMKPLKERVLIFLFLALAALLVSYFAAYSMFSTLISAQKKNLAIRKVFGHGLHNLFVHIFPGLILPIVIGMALAFSLVGYFVIPSLFYNLHISTGVYIMSIYAPALLLLVTLSAVVFIILWRLISRSSHEYLYD